VIYLKNTQQIDKIRRSGQLASRCLDLIETHLKPGITTAELDKIIAVFIKKNGAKAATLGYKGGGGAPPFPGSSCISINDQVVHGIPGPMTIKDGDLVKIDVTTILDGFFGDTARTFMVGQVPKVGVELCQATQKSMMLGIEQVKAGARLGDIGHAIQTYVEAKGFSVVRAFVGHGVGIKFHELPNVPHHGSPGTGYRLKSGMVFTIEPMINAGNYEVEYLNDGWTVVTADGSLSAQFEHTVAVVGSSYEILTLS
jgi:methionyl aminopeptidase